MSRLLGAVLAGGRSSRFGSNKADALLAGQRLIDHAAAVLRPHVDAVVVIGEVSGGLPDLPRGGLGPLGGIAAALDHAAANDYAAVLTIACDMPAVSPRTIADLLRRAPAWCSEAPVLGHWPSALGAHLLAHIENDGDSSVAGWARSVGAVPIAAGGDIANVNTPADLAALERHALTTA